MDDALPRPLSSPRIRLPLSTPVRRLRRHRGLYAALIAVVCLLLCGGLFWRRSSDKDIVNHPYLTVEEVPWELRKFDEPDYGLQSGPQPHEIGCPRTGVMLFMGIFSTAEGNVRRDLIRKYILPDYADADIQVRFILGLVDPEKHGESRTAQLNDAVARENATHGDLVVLPIIDNIDYGKTFSYYDYIVEHYSERAPQFVMKADDDTVWNVPNLVSTFSALDCSKSIYFGTSAGCSEYWGRPYFRGMGYAISWPLVKYLSRTDYQHRLYTEDARVSELLYPLDQNIDRVYRFDMGHNMADWNQINTTENTVALHWIKEDDLVSYNHDRLVEAWERAGREWSNRNGVPLDTLLMSGETRVPPTNCSGWYDQWCDRPEPTEDELASMQHGRSQKAEMSTGVQPGVQPTP